MENLKKVKVDINVKDLFAKIGELFWANGELVEKNDRLRGMCSALEKENAELKSAAEGKDWAKEARGKGK